MVLAALTQGFPVLLKFARQKSLVVSDQPRDIPTIADSTHDTVEEEAESPPKVPRLRKEKPTRLTTVEERLLWLQSDFTQLAPSLLSTTTGLSQLKDSVGRIQRRLRARQAKSRSQGES